MLDARLPESKSSLITPTTDLQTAISTFVTKSLFDVAGFAGSAVHCKTAYPEQLTSFTAPSCTHRHKHKNVCCGLSKRVGVLTHKMQPNTRSTFKYVSKIACACDDASCRKSPTMSSVHLCQNHGRDFEKEKEEKKKKSNTGGTNPAQSNNSES